MTTSFHYSKKHIISYVVMSLSMFCFFYIIFIQPNNFMAYFYGFFGVLFLLYAMYCYQKPYLLWNNQQIIFRQIITHSFSTEDLLNIHHIQKSYFFHFKNGKKIEIKENLIEPKELPLLIEKIESFKEKITKY